MSDRDLGKKLVEEDTLDRFAVAYAAATGLALETAGRGERPDFDCMRADGSSCGVELAQVRRSPDIRWTDQVAHRREWMSADDAVAMVSELAVRKEQKRRQADWRHADDTILVIQLMDCPLSEIGNWLLEALCNDLSDLGFAEIWIADHTTIPAYRDMQLFCIKPEALRGLYERAYPDRKPYG